MQRYVLPLLGKSQTMNNCFFKARFWECKDLLDEEDDLIWYLKNLDSPPINDYVNINKDLQTGNMDILDCVQEFKEDKKTGISASDSKDEIVRLLMWKKLRTFLFCTIIEQVCTNFQNYFYT